MVKKVSQSDISKSLFDKQNAWQTKGEATRQDIVECRQKYPELVDDAEMDTRHVGLSARQGYSSDEAIQIINDIIDANAFYNLVKKVRITKDAEEKEVETISGEKSKLSLADEYYNMFNKDQQLLKAQNDKYDDIRKDLRVLFNDLDTLFHTTYVPIKPTTEAKVIFNAASENIDAIGIDNLKIHPIATPIVKPKDIRISQMKGNTERSKFDRKRIKKIIGDQIERKKPKIE